MQVSIANYDVFGDSKTEKIEISGYAKLKELRAKVLVANGRLVLCDSIIDSMIVNGVLNCIQIKSDVIVVHGRCSLRKVAVGKLWITIEEDDVFDEYDGKPQTLILANIIADEIFIETATEVTVEISGNSVIGSIHFIEGQPSNLVNNSSANPAIYIHRIESFQELFNSAVLVP